MSIIDSAVFAGMDRNRASVSESYIKEERKKALKYLAVAGSIMAGGSAVTGFIISGGWGVVVGGGIGFFFSQAFANTSIYKVPFWKAGPIVGKELIKLTKTLPNLTASLICAIGVSIGDKIKSPPISDIIKTPFLVVGRKLLESHDRRETDFLKWERRQLQRDTNSSNLYDFIGYAILCDLKPDDADREWFNLRDLNLLWSPSDSALNLGEIITVAINKWPFLSYKTEIGDIRMKMAMDLKEKLKSEGGDSKQKMLKKRI